MYAATTSVVSSWVEAANVGAIDGNDNNEISTTSQQPLVCYFQIQFKLIQILFKNFNFSLVYQSLCAWRFLPLP